MTAGTLLRRSLIPFLVIAEPVVFLLYQGGSYCRPMCFRPTSAGVLALALVLLGSGLLAIGLASLVGRLSPFDVPWFERFVPPSTLTNTLLLSFFVAYLFFLTLDTTSFPGAVWKPIVIPLSFPLFLPVWIFYMATFPLSILVALLGIEIVGVATIVIRGLVVFGGFGLAALWQVILATLVSEAVVSD